MREGVFPETRFPGKLVCTAAGLACTIGFSDVVHRPHEWDELAPVGASLAKKVVCSQSRCDRRLTLRCRQFPTVSGVSQGGGLESYRLSSWKLLPKEFWISAITGQGPPDSRDLRVPGPTAPSDPHQSSARRPLRSHTGPRPRGPHRPVSGPTVPSAPDRSPARVHASSDAYCTLLIRCVGKSVWASLLIRQDFPPVDAWSIPHKLLKTR